MFYTMLTHYFSITMGSMHKLVFRDDYIFVKLQNNLPINKLKDSIIIQIHL